MWRVIVKNDSFFFEKDNYSISNCFCLGIGVFETYKVINTYPFVEYSAEHYERLKKATYDLGISFILQEDLILKIIISFLQNLKLTVLEGAIKLVVVDSELFIDYSRRIYTKEQYEKGFKIGLSKIIKSSKSLTVKYKTISNIDNMLELKKVRNTFIENEHFDEVIHFNEHGFVTECCISNIFWTKDNNLYTPMLSCGVLNGIMRSKKIIEYQKKDYIVHEGNFKLNDLLTCDRIFLTNSLMGEMNAKLTI
ncbi:MAG: aminotransferase class IV [Succinivibrionaceae bacterium]